MGAPLHTHPGPYGYWWNMAGKNTQDIKNVYASQTIGERQASIGSTPPPPRKGGGAPTAKNTWGCIWLSGVFFVLRGLFGAQHQNGFLGCSSVADVKIFGFRGTFRGAA